MRLSKGYLRLVALSEPGGQYMLLVMTILFIRGRRDASI